MNAARLRLDGTKQPSTVGVRLVRTGSMSFEVEGSDGPTLSTAQAKYASLAEARAAERDALSQLERSENRWGHLYARGENGRQTIFVLLDEPESGVFATLISTVILLLILASSTCFVVETVESVSQNTRAAEAMHLIETTCIVVFTIEYLARVLTCSQRPRANQSVMKYVLGPMCLIDLVSIAPFYIELLIGNGESGLAVVRMLRMTRIFRCVVGALVFLPYVCSGLTGVCVHVHLQCDEGGHLRRRLAAVRRGYEAKWRGSDGPGVLARALSSRVCRGAVRVRARCTAGPGVLSWSHWPGQRWIREHPDNLVFHHGHDDDSRIW